LKVLSSPGALAILALLLAALAHPAADELRQHDVGRLALPFVALLFLCGLLLLALRARATVVLASGVALALAGLAYDAVRGHAGHLALRPGEATRTFDELGAAGEPLGMRPLGFDLKLQSVAADAATVALSSAPGAPPSLRVTPREAAAVGRLRLGWQRYEARVRLLVGVTRAGQRTDVEVAADQPGTAGGLELRLARYFPDFALDARNQPYSKSSEARNPAALLHVVQGGRTWNVFVLRAAPDIHQVPDLDASFSLRDVAMDETVSLGVYKEPAAPLVAAGVLLAALGILLAAKRS
jgi:hypothetical protein